MSIAFFPLQRAQAQSFNAPVLGAMFGLRASGALGGAALASFVGTGGTAVLGVGLSLAAMYVYDKYISPTATSLPTDKPISQVNLDGNSRPLTDIEKASGFTNSDVVGSQDVVPPKNSKDHPPLWTGTGNVPLGGYDDTGPNGNICGQAPGQWEIAQGGDSRYYVGKIGDPAPNSPGYAPVRSFGSCFDANRVEYIKYVSSNPCAIGYGAASPCNLTNPDVVKLPSDGICQIKRTGNAFAIDKNDPDCIPVAGKANPIPVFTNNNGTLSFISSPNSSGKPSVATVDISNNRGSIAVAVPSASGDTYTTAGINTGVVDPVTGEAPVTTVTSTITNGVGPSSTVITNTTTTNSSSPTTIDIPSNLAKTEDIAAVKEAITALGTPPSSPFTPAPGTAITDTQEIKNIVGNGSILPSIFSFSPILPTSSGVPIISFSLVGRSINLDISVWFGYVRTFLGLLLYTLTPFIIFNIVSGRKEE